MADNSIACFIGHRKINKSGELKKELYYLIENLIIKEQINTFLFGSKSEFNSLCYETVSEIKKKRPDIKRIYVRAEYPNIDEDYKRYLLGLYEGTYYPDSIKGAGRAVYVKRNYEIIDKSRICIFYYDKEYKAKMRKSGTETAVNYAFKKGKRIINIKENISAMR